MESDTKSPYLNKGANGNHKHTLLMLLGCLAPLVIIGILWFAGVSQNILFFGILLLCPVIHLVMMKNLKHGALNIEYKKDNDNKREELT